MNLIRGTTVSGLCGIPPVNGNIIRPLLRISREENEDFLKENGISYVQDSTNSDNEITRNYIRNVLLSCAKKVNPQVIEAADRLSAYTRSDEDYFDSVLDRITDVNDTDLHPALLRRRLQRAYAGLGGKVMSVLWKRDGEASTKPENTFMPRIVRSVMEESSFCRKDIKNFRKGIYELKFAKMFWMEI
jgi:tRNA(Ile)-lysidine synthase TilS/MesJ